MHSYYVKRKKYYFKIERERHKKRLMLLAVLTTAIVILLFPAIRGSSRRLSPPKKRSDDRVQKLVLANRKKESKKEKQRPLANLPKVAIVIDDVGYIQTYIPQFQNMKIPLTFSIMPHSTHGKEDAELFHSLGHEIMLHLPMENKPMQSSYGPGEVTTKMSDEQIIGTLNSDISQVPYIKGINNHEGQVATADRRVMNVVLKCAKDRNLYFLDSLTTRNSVVCQIQGELGMPKRVNDLFIDNKENIEDIKAQMQKLGDLAKKRGVAIGIAHIQRDHTAQGIQEMIPVLKSQGIEFVFLSQISNNR
jgi:polysaccharide deacetylase 2 family uncharacterized protein YibQ